MKRVANERGSIEIPWHQAVFGLLDRCIATTVGDGVIIGLPPP